MIGRQDLALAYHSDDCPSRIACRGADLSLCGRPFDKIKAPAVIQATTSAAAWQTERSGVYPTSDETAVVTHSFWALVSSSRDHRPSSCFLRRSICCWKRR